MLRLVLCLLLFGLPAWAAPEHGLIENRTGLPLTLPLQVKTDPGRDIYLVMRNAETTEIAVTAFIEGGRFFRLLMPPGTYTLHAAIGREWQGAEELFGAHTEFYMLPEALTFRAEATRKRGHLVDLTARDRLAGVPSRTGGIRESCCLLRLGREELILPGFLRESRFHISRQRVCCSRPGWPVAA